MKVSTKFEVDMIIRSLVIALLLLIRYVTVWPWPFTFWPWSVLLHGGSRRQPLHQVWRSYGYPFLSYEFWYLPYGYHWKCVCSHCACAVSRDLCLGGKFFPHIWNLWPRFAYLLYNFYGATIKRQMELSAKTMLKITQLSAHGQNYVSIERCRKSFTTIVLGGHDFLLIASNFGNLTAFRAILSHIFTAHAQKRLFMNLLLKFWHHRSILWPRFPYGARHFRDLRTFSVDFCIG